MEWACAKLSPIFFDSQEKINPKGKGEMQTFWVQARPGRSMRNSTIHLEYSVSNSSDSARVLDIVREEAAREEAREEAKDAVKEQAVAEVKTMPTFSSDVSC